MSKQERTAIVRPMRRDDVDQVLLLAVDEPTAPHWPPFEYLRMLKVVEEEPKRRGAWVVDKAGVTGFAIASQVAGVVDLEAVVISPGARGRGLGTMLVREVMAWATRLGAERLQLEVRASNLPALRLYVRLGFTRDGIRRNYYHNPVEDAFLMGLPLG